MELIIPDTLLYISFAIVTVFFLHSVLIPATSYTVHKHVCLQQEDIYIVQNVNLLRNKDLTPCVYYNHKFAHSVHRQESIGEQDEEGPYLSVFFRSY
ncbi:hypothetical protein ACFQZ1_08900 [Bacillus sp. CGMCC 1.60114]|uniref:hypothetical protein n=1 Tax=unclassified Bacillus (in: firmicutes) TaxID=185979 RepID=UPI003644E60F